MTVKGFIQNLPLFNPGCKAFHQAWQDTDKELGEVRDLAVRFKRKDEDIEALDLYRSTAMQSVRQIKKADTIQTIVEPIFLLGGLCGTVGTGILAMQGMFPSMAAGLITLGCTLTAAYVGGAIYFKALSMRRNNDPNLALRELDYSVHSRVGTLLAQKDSMKEVGILATSLKPAATQTIAQTDTRVVLGGVVVRKRRDGSAVAERVDAPQHPNPNFFGR